MTCDLQKKPCHIFHKYSTPAKDENNDSSPSVRQPMSSPSSSLSIMQTENKKDLTSASQAFNAFFSPTDFFFIFGLNY